MPSSRISRRHWLSAWTCECTVLIVLEPRAGQRQQVVVHPLEMLADDVQAAMRHQVMDVGDPAGDRVVDRDHRALGAALAHRGERLLEGFGRQRRRDAGRPGGRRDASRRRAGPERRCAVPARAPTPAACLRVGRLIHEQRLGCQLGGACRAAPQHGSGPLQIGREYRRRAEPCQRAPRRCSCRPRARAAARAARAARAGSAAARRSAPGRRGDRRRCRCGDRPGPRRSAPSPA